MSRISPHASVDPSAVIGSDCTVEAGAIIGPNVRLGDGCRVGMRAILEGDAEGGAVVGAGSTVGAMSLLGPRTAVGEGTRLLSQVTIAARTTLGARCVAHPFAVLGGAPQDIGHAWADTRLEIGDDCTFREHVTVNRGTPKEDGLTRVGSRCLLMAASHVGHDSVVGDDVILTNAVLLGGHVRMGSRSIVGGSTVFGPFTSVGRCCFVAGGCTVTHDVPPFMIVQGGYKSRPVAVNAVGLRRAGMPAGALRPLQLAFQKLFLSGMRTELAIAAVEAEVESTPEVREVLDSVRLTIGGRHGRGLETMRDGPKMKAGVPGPAADPAVATPPTV